MNSNSSSNEHGGIANKIKGAAQAINGLGENVRGTFLGGVDTVVHRDASSAKNDAIAAQGREQVERGMQNMSGGTAGTAPSSAPSNWSSPGTQIDSGIGGAQTSRGGAMNTGDLHNPYHDPAAENRIPAYDGPGNAQQHLARGTRPVEEPRHHRDDAITTGNPDTFSMGQTSRHVPPEYVARTGGPPADAGVYNRGDETI
ncbi:hypothetical protein R3P38DRAFT_2987424 [Favolaschia claudopus]|uniref:Uncharacterized protein n=1 Tax=Favolaschia claudopus TaxID=2862362 RepID=A0AAW0AXG5_9AGAR